MLKIAICDDYLEHQKVIEQYLKNTQILNANYKLFIFSSGNELINDTNLNEFHLIFLDIVMEDMDGIKALSCLKNLNCYIIFMSNTNDRLRELFQRNVIGFLDKPVKEGEFDKSLKNFLTLYDSEQKKMFTIKKMGVPRQILEADILYFESLGHYIHLHTLNEVITFKEKIGELWLKLQENHSFAMINRSFIVHLKYSSLSTKNTINVGTAKKMINISIGRTRKEEVLKRLIAYAGSQGGV